MLCRHALHELQRDRYTRRSNTTRKFLGGKWRVCALLELGHSGFRECRCGVDWCLAFVQFMLHVEDTASIHLARAAEIDQDFARRPSGGTAGRHIAGAAENDQVFVRRSFGKGRGKTSQRGRSSSCADKSLSGKGRGQPCTRGRSSSFAGKSSPGNGRGEVSKRQGGQEARCSSGRVSKRRRGGHNKRQKERRDAPSTRRAPLPLQTPETIAARSVRSSRRRQPQGGDGVDGAVDSVHGVRQSPALEHDASPANEDDASLVVEADEQYVK